MELITPVQPDVHEVRTCRIGPMSEAEYALLPETLRSEIEAVARGEKQENDTEVLAQSVLTSIKAIRDEVSAHARRFLLNEGLPLEQVSHSFDRLYEANGQELPDRTPENIEAVRQATVDAILFGLSLAMEETLINHAKHGNRDPRRTVGVRYRIDDAGKIHVVSWDEGRGFDPAEVPDPRSPGSLEKVNGRGRLLSASFTDEFEDGSEGPTGRFGTSVHMAVQLTGLDARPEIPAEPQGISVLDKYVGRAAQEVVASARRKAEAAAQQHEERQRDRRLRASWWGLRKRLYDLLGNV